MAHHHIPHEVPTRYLSRELTGRTVSGVLFLVGAVAFFVTLQQDSGLAWKSYVVNWNYFMSLSMGGVMVAVVTWITKAKWNWSLRRIHQALGAYLPIAFLLFIPMLLVLREDYFPWIDMMASDPIVQKKAAYLNIPFLVIRNLVGAMALFGMALAFIYLAVRPDMGQPVGSDDAGRKKWRARLSGGWLGQAEEEDRSYHRMTTLAPAIVLAFAIVMTVFAFDWAMSLEPHWFSTLFGGWFFMGAFWGGLATTAVTAIWLKGQDAFIDEHVGTQQLWDLGKLTFAFTVFWTYLFWSQYLPIWYGKLPWEQAWIIRRSDEPWGALSVLVLVLCFVVPFAGLIGAKPKKVPAIFRTLATVILVGLWLWHYMLIFPSLYHEGDPVLSIWTPLIGLMFLGLFMMSVRWFLGTFPVIQVWQPQVDPEPLEAEVPQAAAS